MNIRTYGPYRMLDEVYSGFRTTLNGLREYREHMLGKSVQGRQILAWSVGHPEKPAVLYISGTHAVEFIGVEQNVAIAKAFAATHKSLLDDVQVFFLPVMNPDGYEKVLRLLRKHLIPLVKTNARRVDLNRNFPVGFYAPHKRGIMGGSHRKTINYHGPAPMSEPESRALAKLVDIANPAISLALHSFGGSLRYPPCHDDKPTPDVELFQMIASEMVSQQAYPYVIGHEFELYPTYGDINDWLYFEKDVLPFLMEIGNFGISGRPPASWYNIFMWANPDDVAATTTGNTPACIRLAEAAAHGAKKGKRQSAIQTF